MSSKLNQRLSVRGIESRLRLSLPWLFITEGLRHFAKMRAVGTRRKPSGRYTASGSIRDLKGVID